MKKFSAIILSTLFLFSFDSHPQTKELPKQIIDNLPHGYIPKTHASSDFNRDGKIDYIVVVYAKDEEEILSKKLEAPKRILLAFIQKTENKFSLVSHNDEVVYKADEGGQCDPFLFSADGLYAKGIFFTVQNVAACGSHWTDYITFKYSDTLDNFIFHKRITEVMAIGDPKKSDDNGLVVVSRKVKQSIINKNITLSEFSMSDQ